MSTEPGPSRRRPARFLAVAATTVVALAVAAASLAGLAVVQGPRVTAVQSDPDGATNASGSRIIVTANQPLHDVAPEQVVIEPSVAFTVETSGRRVGIRLSEALQNDTAYDLRIVGVTGLSGGAASTFHVPVRTPPAVAYLIERSATEDDRIFRTALDGGERTTVFQHPRIEDFRLSPRGLLISVIDDQGDSELLIQRLDGVTEEVALPGIGRLARLQLSASGDRFGYTWTDASIEGLPARDSFVFLGSLAAPQAAPERLDLKTADPRIDDFRFVPGTTALLLITRGDDLLLADPAKDAEPSRLGIASVIDDVLRDEPVAYVRTADGPERVDLRTGERASIARAGAAGFGSPFSAEEVAGRGTLLTYLRVTDAGSLDRQTVVLDTGDSSPRELLAVPPTDAVVQVCAAPNGRAVAAVVAPDIATNPLDDAILSMPTGIETRILSLDRGDVVTVPGFAISWCRAPAS